MDSGVTNIRQERTRRRGLTVLAALLLFGAGAASAYDRRVIAEMFSSPT
jgi:hypothetical protein